MWYYSNVELLFSIFTVKILNILNFKSTNNGLVRLVGTIDT